MNELFEKLLESEYYTYNDVEITSIINHNGVFEVKFKHENGIYSDREMISPWDAIECLANEIFD